MKSPNTHRVRQFVFNALHIDLDHLAVSDTVAMEPGDWDYLLHLSSMHRLDAMLYNRLCREELLDNVPGRVMTSLRDQHRQHTLRNLALYRELVAVTQALNSAGIPSIALKGAYLARFAYPDIGLRPMRDLDLLVPEDKVVDAFELLKEKEYQPDYDVHLKTCLETQKHLPGLTSPDGNVIELHHRLMTPEPHRNPLLRDDIFQRSISRTIGETDVRFLCPEDLLLHLCIHASLDHELNVGPLVLADIAFLVETHELDWGDFRAGVDAGGWQRCVQPLLDMAHRHLGANIPLDLPDCGAGVRETTEFLLFSELEDHRMLHESVQKIRATCSFAEKLRAMASRVFLSRSGMAAQYPVDPRSPKVFLYYPVRWYRLVTQVFPKLLKGYAKDSMSLDELAAHKSAYRQWLESGNR